MNIYLDSRESCSNFMANCYSSKLINANLDNRSVATALVSDTSSIPFAAMSALLDALTSSVDPLKRNVSERVEEELRKLQSDCSELRAGAGERRRIASFLKGLERVQVPRNSTHNAAQMTPALGRYSSGTAAFSCERVSQCYEAFKPKTTYAECAVPYLPSHQQNGREERA